MSSQDLEKIKSEFAAADLKMLQAEKDLDKLNEFMSNYESMIQNIHELTDFYFNQNWREKVELLEKENMANYGSTSQDGIWNLHVEFQAEKIRLLKLISDDIYRDTFE